MMTVLHVDRFVTLETYVGTIRNVRHLQALAVQATAESCIQDGHDQSRRNEQQNDIDQIEDVHLSRVSLQNHAERTGQAEHEQTRRASDGCKRPDEYQSDEEIAHLQQTTRFHWMNNGDISFDRNQQHRNDGRRVRQTLNKVIQFAHGVADHPVTCHVKCVVLIDTEQGHTKVTKGQVGQKVVGDRVHFSRHEYHQNDQQITCAERVAKQKGDKTSKSK